MEIEFRSFNSYQIEALHQAFISAFSDYFVDFQPSIEQFRRRLLHKLNINGELSQIAWHEGRIVGFVLHSLNEYQGQLTLYNGGTGVLLQNRRKHIATNLLENSLKNLDPKVNRVILEVMQQNDAAIRLYQSLGFQSRQKFKCFKLKSDISSRAVIEVVQSNQLKTSYEAHFSFFTGFLDSTRQLEHNLMNEIILEARKNRELIGHLIFQPRLGRISQFAVNKLSRGQGVGRALLASAQYLSHVRELTLMNVPENETDTVESLLALGFKNELDQIEMELKL